MRQQPAMRSQPAVADQPLGCPHSPHQAGRHKAGDRRHAAAAAGRGGLSQIDQPGDLPCLLLAPPSLPPRPALPLPIHVQLEASLGGERPLQVQGDAARPATSTQQASMQQLSTEQRQQEQALLCSMLSLGPGESSQRSQARRPAVQAVHAAHLLGLPMTPECAKWMCDGSSRFSSKYSADRGSSRWYLQYQGGTKTAAWRSSRRTLAQTVSTACRCVCSTALGTPPS